MKTVIYKVFLAIVLAKATAGILMKKPMGIKMCERECQCLKGCYSIRYDTASLQCTPLTDPNDKLKDSPPVITRTVPRSKDPPCLLLSCSEEERSDQLVCIPREESPVDVKDMSSSLLLVPFNDDVTTAFKIDLITKEIQPLPFFWKHVFELVPVPREEKYLIAFRVGVISSPMNRCRNTQIFAKVKIRIMVLDWERALVFMYMENGRTKAIARMKTDGRKRKGLLIVEHGPLQVIVIDPLEQKVYFKTKKNLIRVNYNGKTREVLVADHNGVVGLQYLPSKGQLYFQDAGRDELLRETIPRNVSVVVKKIGMIRSSAFYSGVFYFSGDSKDQISSIRIDEEPPTVVTYPLSKTAVKDSWKLFVLPTGQKQFR